MNKLAWKQYADFDGFEFFAELGNDRKEAEVVVAQYEDWLLSAFGSYQCELEETDEDPAYCIRITIGEKQFARDFAHHFCSPV